MIELDKTSHLVLVSTDVLLSELKDYLAEEALHFGFYPLDDPSYSLNYYLSKRTPNLYHFCYGGLADLVSSATIELKNGKTFKLKDAPRSAVGPDFNRMIIGSRDQFGSIKSATLKLTTAPEQVSHLALAINNRDEARAWIQDLVGRFIAPLYFRHLDTSVSSAFFDAVKFKTDRKECLLMSFGGLKDIIEVAHAIIDKRANLSNTPFKWLERHSAVDIIHPYIFVPDSLKNIREQYRQFLWPTSDVHTQLEFEKDFIKFYHEH